LAFLSRKSRIPLPSAMPSRLSGSTAEDTMMSRARPWGCHFIESGRYPPIVLICGNAAETARLVRMV
jgi:hypothetical protein